jgi:ABC-type dipeptide/oligopeptide/nickel transport system permease component
MQAYILKSLLRALVIMFIVMTVVFMVVRLGPLDPAQYILGDYATGEALKSLRESMGLDKPILRQYFDFLNRLIHGDLGRSFLTGQPVLTHLREVLPYTIELVVGGILLAILLGIPPGVLAALRPNGVFDQIIRLLTLGGISLPVFVTGIFLMIIFSLKLNLLPAIGVGVSDDFTSRLIHLILPAFSAGFHMMASITRLTRASLLDVLQKDYVTTARSKGLSETIVIFKHALRNSLLPVVTFLGIYINILLGAAVLTEVIFNRPGVGRLIVEAIKSSDFPTIQTLIMLYAGTVVFVNVLTDLVYSFVDPRIAHE